MLCKKPFLKSASQPFGCGQCLPCRFNRRRVWSNRMMLESLTHAESSFVTLTYRDEALPPSSSLVPRHTQLWLKSLRKAAKAALRFYLVGEYGDQTHRPHYHAIIYGLPPYSPLFQETWKKGFVHTGELTPDSAQYVAGYVVKKLTSKEDPRLNGRHPEFARMSLRPGIGATAVPNICDVLTSDAGCNSIMANGDVPAALKMGTRSLPLGRYLRSKIRKELGHDPKTPQELLLRLQIETTSLITEALQNQENKSKSVKRILVDLNKQKVLNLETRLKIFSKKGDL